MASEVRAVTSRDNPLLARLRRLVADPGAYRRSGELLIEGEHLCSAFLRRGGVPPQAIVGDTAWERPEVRSLALQAGTVTRLPDALMSGLSALDSAPALGFVIPWTGPGALAEARPTVVLDRLQDAGNVGTILRSAAAFGFSQIAAIKGTAGLWSPKVLRAGMGAHFALNLVEGLEADAVVQLGLPLLGTSSHTAHLLHEAFLPWPCAWVFGHEGQGMSAALAGQCADVLRILQPGGEESLNVAAAAAVCLYESARQRA